MAAAGCGRAAAPPQSASADTHDADAAPSATASSPGPHPEAGSLDDLVDAPGAAWELRRVSTGEVVASHQQQRLTAAILPGSVAKVVTALAALEQGRGGLRVACAGRLVVHGRELACVHPAIAEPLDLRTALAHSCNTYFARLGALLDRTAWQRVAARIGVPARGWQEPPELIALGLAGPTASASAWRDVVMRALDAESVPANHRQGVRAGMQAATRAGTALALADPWRPTLAKTGTAPGPAGVDGLMVAVRPEEDLDLVVRVRGAGRDAAAVAAAVFDRAAPEARVVRVGRRDGQAPDVLPLETYVSRVVTAEAAPDTPRAALEALAIAVRTFTTAHRDRHVDKGADVCDTTHCQVLADVASRGAVAAGASTRGLVLARAGRVVPVHFSAMCDGRLSAASDVWPGDATPSSGGGSEPFPHDVARWQSRLPARALETALRDEGWHGDALRGVRVAAQSTAGRPQVVEVDGLRPSRLPADAFRTIVGRHLGWDVIKSYTWQLTRTADGYRVEGRGKGHGVGLCVTGAAAGAARGADTNALLHAYFPDLALRSVSDEVILRVRGAAQAEAPALLALVYEALARLRQRLQVGAPRRVEVVEHATIEAYQRATHRAWWTGGSTRHLGGTAYRIDLPPRGGPDRGGEVARRVRHEVVHVLTERALASAPLWAREGLAVHLSDQGDASGPVGEEPGSASATDACPDDAALLRPGGADQMRRAYGRAAACVTAALERRPSWRDLAP